MKSDLAVTFSMGIETMVDSVVGVATHAGTQRLATVINTKTPPAYYAVRGFLDTACADVWPPQVGALVAEPVGKQILDEAKSLVTQTWTGRYVRARAGLLPPLAEDPSHYGPNPKPTGEGRYNGRKEPCLYLAETVAVARAEMRASATDVVYMQAFELDLSELRFLELPRNAEATHPHLNAILFVAEQDANQDETIYRPSHVVRFLLETLGISGFQYPSVRGAGVGSNLILWGPALGRAMSQMAGVPKPC
ncbi:MAG: RES family NAD+ phosphorylase [bacterium]